MITKTKLRLLISGVQKILAKDFKGMYIPKNSSEINDETINNELVWTLDTEESSKYAYYIGLLDAFYQILEYKE